MTEVDQILVRPMPYCCLILSRVIPWLLILMKAVEHLAMTTLEHTPIQSASAADDPSHQHKAAFLC